MITRHGDFTQKQYIYKVYENGFNHKRKHYITGDTFLEWRETLDQPFYDAGTIHGSGVAHDGEYTLNINGWGTSNGFTNGVLIESDVKKPAEIKNSDLSFEVDFSAQDNFGKMDKCYVEVFSYKIVIDKKNGAVEAFYDGESIASGVFTDNFNFIRMREQDGTFYIDNSDDRETWSNFISRGIEDGDETTSTLKFHANTSTAGAGMFAVTLHDVRWLRHDYGFKGIIDKVVDNLQFTTHINTPASSTTVKINQNPLELPEYIKNGAFVDIYVNYWGYLAYAQQGTINDENDEPIRDETDGPIMGVFSEELTPEKDSWLRFSGYINSIESDYDAQTVTLGLISHGEELNNILVVSENRIRTKAIEQPLQNTSEVISVAQNRRQTFRLDKQQLVSAVGMYVNSGSGGLVPVTVEVGRGNTILSTGEGLASSVGAHIIFALPDEITLEAGVDYWLRPVGNGVAQWFYQNTDAYGGGSRQTLSGGVWSNTATDYCFSVWTKSYEIEQSFTGNSVSLGESFRQILYRNSSQVTIGDIDDNGKNVNLYLKLNTAKDALEKIGQLMTLGWWWAIDPGTNEYTLKAPPSVVDHTFYVGRDILTLKIKKDITNLVNDLYYIGGEINEAQKQLTIRTEDVESIAKFRRGLATKSDGRVYRYDTAQAFSDFEIMNNKDEVITTDIEIQAKTYDIETIRVGDLVNIVNAGGERIKLQVAGVNYSPLKVKLSLSSVPPTLLRTIAATTRSLEQSLTNDANNAI